MFFSRSVKSMNEECEKIKNKNKCQSKQIGGITETHILRAGNCPISDGEDWAPPSLDELKLKYSEDNILTPTEYEQLSTNAWGMTFQPENPYNDNFIEQPSKFILHNITFN